MKEQPEALRLTAWFYEEDGFNQGTRAPHKWVLQANSELSRLHEKNQELVEALELCRNDLASWMQDYGKDDETVECVLKANAALGMVRGTE